MGPTGGDVRSMANGRQNRRDRRKGETDGKGKKELVRRRKSTAVGKRSGGVGAISKRRGAKKKRRL